MLPWISARGLRTTGNGSAVELSGENRAMLYVPPGFAHGFLVLSEYRGSDVQVHGGILAGRRPGDHLERPGHQYRLAASRPASFCQGRRASRCCGTQTTISGIAIMKYLITAETASLPRHSSRGSKSGRLTSPAPEESLLDITDANKRSPVSVSARPDVIINCAAYNLVDKAEQDPETALSA